MNALILGCLLLTAQPDVPVDPPLVDPPIGVIDEAQPKKPPAPPAYLTIRSNAKTATICINKSITGSIGKKLDLTAGTHHVMIAAKGYWDRHFDVTLRPKQHGRLTVRMLPGVSLAKYSIEPDRFFGLSARVGGWRSFERSAWSVKNDELVLEAKRLPGNTSVAQIKAKIGRRCLLRFEYRIDFGSFTSLRWFDLKNIPLTQKRWHTIVFGISAAQAWHRIDWARAVESRSVRMGRIKTFWIYYPQRSPGKLRIRNVMFYNNCEIADYMRACLSCGIKPKVDEQ